MELAETQAQLNAVFKHVACALHNTIVVHSPYDTGQMKANFYIADGDVDSAPMLHLAEDVRLEIEVADAISTARQADVTGAGSEITILANTDYAEDLERGKSNQAPDGFIREAIELVRSELAGDQLHLQQPLPLNDYPQELASTPKDPF